MEVEFTKFTGSILLEFFAIVASVAVVLAVLLYSKRPKKGSMEHLRQRVKEYLKE